MANSVAPDQTAPSGLLFLLKNVCLNIFIVFLYLFSMNKISFECGQGIFEGDFCAISLGSRLL